MEITIKGEAKEVATLLLKAAGRLDNTDSCDSDSSCGHEVKKDNLSENQRSDLSVLMNATINDMRKVWSNIKLIELYLQEGIDGEAARRDIHGMLIF